MYIKKYLYSVSFYLLLIMGLLGCMVSLILMMFNIIYFFEWDLFSFNSVELTFIMLFDYISVFFMSCVMLISSMVIYYSISYMSSDMNKVRFLLLVLMFIFSMMFMILSPNLVSILLGWDGLGLVSFCLVIYYQNLSSYNAGMLTILSNRLGDVAILMCIAWSLNFGSWNFYFYYDYLIYDNYIMIISSLIIIASMTKSAQMPFSAWLPAAMAAPTPVSALVHSSTLVTAGVYLMIRFKNFISFNILQILLIMGCLTMFMSGLSANYEFDLKKIIALSTLSQLGLMMGILSFGFSDLAYFHLLTHAFFKALLFLCAGALIHSFVDNQDIRFMGSNKFMPLMFSSFLVSNLVLCGMPFLSGFYSKDLILEMLSMSSLNLMIYFLMYFSTGLTVSYSVRLIWYVFFFSGGYFSLSNLHGEDYMMMKGIWFLVMNSIFMGLMISWVMFPSFYYIFLPSEMKLLVLLVMFLGLIMGIFISYMAYSCLGSNMEYYLSWFMGSMWFLSYISVYMFNDKFIKVGNYVVKILDFGWMEYFISLNIMKMLMVYVKMFQKIQWKFIKNFLMMFIVWIFMFMLFM
uniref:NADH dehydrogenase subunit 5 n=1 Tax=Olinga feredayi TaxID=177813 RepID=UPI0028D03350|nr:NADH dehydrogenase subunit 5 [Olinga feredayi]WMQ76529.1 NADH dehydrogenase subunit 5 [Olinga feredayi]